LLAGGAVVVAVLAPSSWAEEASRAVRAEAADDKRWQAVAPGRVEPASGEIKIGAPMLGVIGEVLVKANDKVLAGEPLVRLMDNEAQARLATAEAQIALRRRLRNDENPSARAATRRRAEDAVADADKGVIDAQAALDRAATERRAGRGSDADVAAARTALSRAQDRLTQQKAELRRVAGRAFLVGKGMKDSPYTRPTFGGLVVWVPLDSVTTLVEVEAPKPGKAAPGR